MASKLVAFLADTDKTPLALVALSPHHGLDAILEAAGSDERIGAAATARCCWDHLNHVSLVQHHPRDTQETCRLEQNTVTNCSDIPLWSSCTVVLKRQTIQLVRAQRRSHCCWT